MPFAIGAAAPAIATAVGGFTTAAAGAAAAGGLTGAIGAGAAAAGTAAAGAAAAGAAVPAAVTAAAPSILGSVGPQLLSSAASSLLGGGGGGDAGGIISGGLGRTMELSPGNPITFESGVGLGTGVPESGATSVSGASTTAVPGASTTPVASSSMGGSVMEFMQQNPEMLKMFGGALQGFSDERRLDRQLEERDRQRYWPGAFYGRTAPSSFKPWENAS